MEMSQRIKNYAEEYEIPVGVVRGMLKMESVTMDELEEHNLDWAYFTGFEQWAEEMDYEHTSGAKRIWREQLRKIGKDQTKSSWRFGRGYFTWA